MSDAHNIQVRDDEEYKQAGKIIRVLIDRKLIKGSSIEETYSNVWAAAFEILDLFKQERVI